MSAKPYRPRFWIIDLGTPGENDQSKTAIGPFVSVAAAEAWLRQDGAETFATADEKICDAVGRTDREWASPVHIVEVRKTVLQVPVVKVTCDLVEAGR